MEVTISNKAINQPVPVTRKERTSQPTASKQEHESVYISEKAQKIGILTAPEHSNISNLPSFLSQPNNNPDPMSGEGNVFSFLTDSDREELTTAYINAEENGLDKKAVGQAAFIIAVGRYREAMISSGVKYSIHTPEIQAQNDRLAGKTTEVQELDFSRVEAGSIAEGAFDQFKNLNLNKTVLTDVMYVLLNQEKSDLEGLINIGKNSLNTIPP